MLVKLNEDNIKWADMVRARCQEWTSKDRCDFDAFVQAIARHVRDAGGTLEVIVNDIRQAGLSFRGAAGLDFVWVRLNQKDFNAVSTETLRKKGLRILEQTTHASECGWPVLARQVMAAHDFSVTSSRRRVKSEVNGNCDSLFATSPKPNWATRPKTVTKEKRFDIERCATDMVNELVSLAEISNSNGFKFKTISALSVCKSMEHAQVKAILDVLCKSGQLVKINDLYYLASSSSELVCCDTQDAVSPPDRYSTTISRPSRDSARVRDLKLKYAYRCQICGGVLKLPKSLYAEVHHLRPRGGPHNGSDFHDNMIVVCPNHHVLLDYGAIPIEKLELSLHRISDASVKYHNERIYGNALRAEAGARPS